MKRAKFTGEMNGCPQGIDRFVFGYSGKGLIKRI
jgi:hypothetical protein